MSDPNDLKQSIAVAERKLTNGMITQAQQVADRSYAALIQNHPNNQLPERIFKSNFLPLFTGTIPQEHYHKAIETWVAIAGTPTSAVDVINENSGEVLYTVPSIMDTSSLNVVHNSRMSYGSILSAADRAKIHGKAASDNEFLEGAAQKLKTEQFTGTEAAIAASQSYHDAQWKSIFDRYGVTVNNVVATQAKEAGSSEKVSLDYDDSDVDI
jgi:hypothetical protein